MSRDKKDKPRPLWTRRWVQLAVVALVLFGAGYAVGAGGGNAGTASTPTVEQQR